MQTERRNSPPVSGAGAVERLLRQNPYFDQALGTRRAAACSARSSPVARRLGRETNKQFGETSQLPDG